MDDALKEKLKDMLISGAISGGVLGAGGKALGGFSKWRDLAKAGAIGATAGAGLSGGAGLVGNLALGTAEEGEQNPNTKRGALGGAIGGGLLGAGAGAMAASPKVRGLMRALMMKSAKGGEMVAGLEKTGDNLLLDQMRKIKNPLVGAGVGGVGLGALAGYAGADEGMQLDVVDNERRDAQRRKLIEDEIKARMGG